MGILILASLMLAGFVGMSVRQLATPLSASRLPLQWLILLLLFAAILFAFAMVPADAERITPIFRQPMR